MDVERGADEGEGIGGVPAVDELGEGQEGGEMALPQVGEEDYMLGLLVFHRHELPRLCLKEVRVGLFISESNLRCGRIEWCEVNRKALDGNGFLLYLIRRMGCKKDKRRRKSG